MDEKIVAHRCLMHLNGGLKKKKGLNLFEAYLAFDKLRSEAAPETDLVFYTEQPWLLSGDNSEASSNLMPQSN